jgi:hypothetical protein
MSEPTFSPWKKFRETLLSRRNLIRGAAGTALGAGLLRPKLVFGRDDDAESERATGFGPRPILGGVAPLAPLGIFVHHNPLSPASSLTSLKDPSQITDFDGFVGLTNIHGGGTGIDAKGVTKPLGFRADMGFSKGKFIGTDGREHTGTFAFV